MKQNDFLEVVHLVDTDGAYISDNSIEKTEDRQPVYNDEMICISTPQKIACRNRQKRQNLNVLVGASEVWGHIPYSVYFFSCNLDHVLHNNANLPAKEKDSKALVFANKFQQNPMEFIQFINQRDIYTEDTYKDSWEYIKKGTNSLKRKTNFGVFFSQEAKSFPREFLTHSAN